MSLPDPLRIRMPFVPLHISGDEAGNALRQAEAARINAQTNRTVDAREIVNRFVDVVRKANA